MSKRPFFPQQNGDRKKARLDVTISDHNFPLSQNGLNREPDQNNWGDDNDDEILLLASQACEDAINDISSLPDYSLCMQPASTSTQLCDPGPSTSKAKPGVFAFKKPTTTPSSTITSNLKDKCNRISSPLPGMSSKVLPKQNNHLDLTDDLIFNDKILKGQDSDLIYKQLLQLQEENAKLKSENGKLLEKCVTKEGEASILRTQLKTCQMAVDNARMEKIKAQEKIQMECTEKVAATNSKMHEMRTQLDFKNLEIISIKERCKMLESNKVKVNQVTVPTNDISLSQRMNNSFAIKDTSIRKPKMASNSVQTEDKAHFLKLNKTCRSEPSVLTPLLPAILEPSSEQLSIREYFDKLKKKHREVSRNKCRVYSTFHRIPDSNETSDRNTNKNTSHNMTSLYESVTRIASGNDEDGKAFYNILSMCEKMLFKLHEEIQMIEHNTWSLKEIDEKYIDATASFLVVDKKDLLASRPLYKDEQAVLARRIIAVSAYILCNVQNQQKDVPFKCFIPIGGFTKALKLLIHPLYVLSCGVLYSGLLLSTIYLLDNFLEQTDTSATIEIVKNMIVCRPLPIVSCKLLKLLRKFSLKKWCLGRLCKKSSTGNLKLDYDQGVLSYNDSCHLQIVLKQVETSLKYMEDQSLVELATETITDLMAFYNNIKESFFDKDEPSNCDCQLVLLQVIVYGLRILAVMLKSNRTEDQTKSTRLLGVCRSGVQILYQCILRDVEFSSQLVYNEGHLIEFIEIMKEFDHNEYYGNMLSELSISLQPSPEEESSSFHNQPWEHSFQNFTITD